MTSYLKPLSLEKHDSGNIRATSELMILARCCVASRCGSTDCVVSDLSENMQQTRRCDWSDKEETGMVMVSPVQNVLWECYRHTVETYHESNSTML